MDNRDKLQEEEFEQEEFVEEYPDEDIPDAETLVNMTEEEIIGKLLARENSPQTKTFYIRELGIPITIKALSEREIQVVRKEATRKVKRGRKLEEEFDDGAFNAGIVAKATIKPDFNNPKLLRPLKVSSGQAYLLRHVKGGTLTNICNEIISLSGYDEELEEVVKNG